MKRFLYAAAFFVLMCWSEHSVLHGHGDKWWLPLFAAWFGGINFAMSAVELEKKP
jgi:hypothetical protein